MAKLTNVCVSVAYLQYHYFRTFEGTRLHTTRVHGTRTKYGFRIFIIVVSRLRAYHRSRSGIDARTQTTKARAETTTRGEGASAAPTPRSPRPRGGVNRLRIDARRRARRDARGDDLDALALSSYTNSLRRYESTFEGTFVLSYNTTRTRVHVLRRPEV